MKPNKMSACGNCYHAYCTLIVQDSFNNFFIHHYLQYIGFQLFLIVLDHLDHLIVLIEYGSSGIW